MFRREWLQTEHSCLISVEFAAETRTEDRSVLGCDAVHLLEYTASRPIKQYLWSLSNMKCGTVSIAGIPHKSHLSICDLILLQKKP